MEATKKAGLIIDYKVFRATPKSADQPNIYLWITYKNMAALDKGVELPGCSELFSATQATGSDAAPAPRPTRRQ